MHLPLAVSRRAADEFTAKSELITVANDTITKKVDKHSEVEPASFSLVQQILDGGEWTEGSDPAVRNILAVIDGVHWVLAIRASRKGYIQLRTLFRASARRHASIRRREARFKAERE